jgi:ribosomal protein S8
MVTDRIGDFIIRLQNAAKIGKREVSAPYSKHLLAIATKLKELGYVSDVEVKATPRQKRPLL